uniref:Uncharacterized protein n=1 Tax=Rhizophora mucronata TaxID=61149 RepID=A0A2P2MYU7_RHIMU
MYYSLNSVCHLNVDCNFWAVLCLFGFV